MKFNKEQSQAIYQRDASILVSAPAGSGKTRILVNRIIELLKEGYNIDEFLVLTFTEAAGLEMKQRLKDELIDYIENCEDESLKNHLSLQLTLLPNAYITNFHGFCSLLLKKYGYLVDVMPGFKINSDPISIKKEALKVCEEKWITDDNKFLSLYFTEHTFDKLEDMILKIDAISHSIAHFDDYVDDILNNNYSFNNINESRYVSLIKHTMIDELTISMNRLVELKAFCENHDLDMFYERPDQQTKANLNKRVPYDSLYDYIDERLQALNHQLDYESLVRLLKGKPDPSYNMSWKDVDPQIKSEFTKLKSNVLGSYNDALKKYIEKDEETLKEKLSISKDALEIIFNSLLKDFNKTYTQKKNELQELDFNDLESYTLKLLEPEYGIVVRLYSKIKEIMIDEYQDTNQIQEDLINKIARYKDPEIHRFMVGDMKQSIYRFRNADPELFKDKYDTYDSLVSMKHTLSPNIRIDLRYNYRSSKVVLDSINYIFNSIMDLNVGGLNYYLDESARLNYDPSITKQCDDTLKTEILLNLYDPEDKNKEEYEAHMVAQRIVRLKQEMLIEGKPIKYSDIAILMRNSTNFLAFKKVFNYYNIPNLIVLSSGLFTSIEVQSMIAFLKAVNNPYDDISLLSVLRMPYTITGFSEETIARLRINKSEPLYNNLKASDDEKIKAFLKILNDYQKILNPYELLIRIYDDTQYPLFVSSLINGQQRKANLDLLLEIVKDMIEDHPYLDDLIDELENCSDRTPGNISGNEDAIQFMTIHKSKGLEFPIVFVCNLHVKFNKMDTRERLVIDKKNGFAIKPRIKKTIDDIEGIIVEYDLSYRDLINKYSLKEMINEEMRILYVALTRAKYKLILTGAIKDYNEIIDIQKKLLINEHADLNHRTSTVLLYDSLRMVDNNLAWILMGTLRHQDMINDCKKIDELVEYALKLEKCHFNKKLIFDYTNNALFSMNIYNDNYIDSHKPDNTYSISDLDLDKQEAYRDYNYSFETHPKSKAVTALVGEEEDHFEYFDDVGYSVTMKATDRGTLVHLFMSSLNFKNDDFDEILERMYKEELISITDREALIEYKPHIVDFINSDIYKSISGADYIYKEKYFSYLDGDQAIHGIFDLVYIIKDHYYVLDYKTDRLKEDTPDSILIDSHYTQLTYYKKVLKEMYHHEIKAILYYLHINKSVEF